MNVEFPTCPIAEPKASTVSIRIRMSRRRRTGRIFKMASSIQAADSQDVVLSVRDLSVSLPGGMERAYAVENISFDLKRGQILCIIGESGSGKSVTANAIMGLLPKVIRVSSGAIHLAGKDITSVSPDALRSLRGRVASMIFQDPLSALN